jgi:pimeloyl-ACP methyl ester carboxylesterase
MNATWIDTLGSLNGAARSWALASRPGIHLIDIGAAELRVRDLGPRDAPAYVFAADAPVGIEHYDALLARWPAHLRAIVLEMPGFGFSRPRPGFDFTLGAYAQTAINAIATLECRKPSLVFACAWGFVALEVVRRAPGLIERLILPQTPSWEDMTKWVGRVDRRVILRRPIVGQALMKAASTRVARQWFRTAYPDRAFGGALSATADDFFNHGCRFSLASLMQGLEHAQPPRVTRTPPVTVLWGGGDRTHKSSSPSGIQQLAPHAQVVLLKDAGHSPELEFPEELLRLVTASAE